MFLGIKFEGWLTIFAIFLGPLLAFVVQNWRDSRRAHQTRKLEIYRKLMLTLKVPLNPNHVDAINSIPVEFFGDNKVLAAWRLYASHLNRHAQPGDELQRWAEKKFDLLIDLVYAIGQSLGYEAIDKAAMRDQTYVPQGYANVEAEQETIRKAVLELLTGRRPLPMTMVGPVQVEQPLPLVEQLPEPQQGARPALPPPAGSENH
ncbi:MAG: DUF6680 family protein [Terriglobales bacterium]